MTASIVHHNNYTRIFAWLIVCDDRQRPTEVLNVTRFLHESALSSTNKLSPRCRLPVSHDKLWRSVFVKGVVAFKKLRSLKRKTHILVIAAVFGVVKVAHLSVVVGYRWLRGNLRRFGHMECVQSWRTIW